MNTTSYYSPLSERSFSFILFLVIFALFVLLSVFSDASLTFRIFLTVFGCAASVIITLLTSQFLYNEIYRPTLRWWYSKRVDRDTEMAPIPLMLHRGSAVHAMWGGELHEGIYVGPACNGSYAVRLSDGRVIAVSEVYLKVE